MMQDPPPSPFLAGLRKLRPAGEVLMQDKRKSSAFHHMQQSEFALCNDGASMAVKHFYGNFLPNSNESAKVAPSSDETTDAGVDSSAGHSSGGDHSPSSSSSTQRGVRKQKKRGAGHFADPKRMLKAELFNYNMNHESRGIFMIFNYVNFHPSTGQKQRKGSDKDAENLQNMARNLGFEHTRIFRDYTVEDTHYWIHQIANSDHRKYDCFACAILTHGGDDDVLFAHDGKMKMADFTAPFESHNSTTLAGKPKMFFVQACRGKKTDVGFAMAMSAYDDGDYDDLDGEDCVDAQEQPVRIPSQADFLIAHSTAKEYYSWRNESNGSIFIQALCSTFNVYHTKKDILQMLTYVNCMVAYEFESTSKKAGYDSRKQIPSITTQLTATVHFYPKAVSQGRTFHTKSAVVAEGEEEESSGDVIATDDQPSNVTSSTRKVRRQKSYELATMRSPCDEMGGVEAIRRSFYPPPHHVMSPPPSSLLIPPPTPNIKLTEATPTTTIPPAPQAIITDVDRAKTRIKRSSFSTMSDLEAELPHGGAVERKERSSFPLCHTHLRLSEQGCGGYVMETDFL